jgi:hypothetical protein
MLFAIAAPDDELQPEASFGVGAERLALNLERDVAIPAPALLRELAGFDLAFNPCAGRARATSLARTISWSGNGTRPKECLPCQRHLGQPCGLALTAQHWNRLKQNFERVAQILNPVAGGSFISELPAEGAAPGIAQWPARRIQPIAQAGIP